MQTGGPEGQRTVEVLAKESGLGIAIASQHLKVLRAACLVESEKVELIVVYRLADQAVCEFFHTICVLAGSSLATGGGHAKQLTFQI